ncbi:MAG: hypothetical protein QHH19_04420 [Candidatus Thermoplasmatota archaeon]|jgi:uncharacterized protein (DUF983 family)|nr:hypothetical protein [Candidatus Thermoplasmatota archaeon]
MKCSECGKETTIFYELDNKKLCLGCYSDLVEYQKDALETFLEMDPMSKIHLEEQAKLGWIWKYQYYIAIGIAIIVILLITLIWG